MIAATVAVIFLHFYKKQNENVCFYICDSSDGQQHVRKRKFDAWFAHYNKGAFMKIDAVINDKGNINYPVAIILLHGNIYGSEIVNAFLTLIDSYNRDK